MFLALQRLSWTFVLKRMRTAAGRLINRHGRFISPPIHLTGKFWTFCTQPSIGSLELISKIRWSLNFDNTWILSVHCIWMTRHYSRTVKGWKACRKTNPWKCYIKDKNCLWGQICSFMVLFHVHSFCTPPHQDWSGSPIKADLPTAHLHTVFLTASLPITNRDGCLWRRLQAWHDPGRP